MIDPNNLDALWQAVQNHDDYRGGVIWIRKDIENAAHEAGIDADTLDENVHMGGWEDVAIGHGWEYVINPAVFELKEEEDENATV